jgi:8-oxo-dGTP pyrophosphatase MutT (NUDIX family)
MKISLDTFPNLEFFELKLAQILSTRQKNDLPDDGMVTAAVLIALFSKDSEPHVLLTKRSNHVEHHKGEISFPGGKMDDTDPDLLSCALRETEEEVGICVEDVKILGEMDDFYTVATNYLVVPFVGVIPYPYEFRPSAREIEQVLCVPLRVFFDPTLVTHDTWTVLGKPLKMTFYHWKGHTIWGATARILENFTRLMDRNE